MIGEKQNLGIFLVALELAPVLPCQQSLRFFFKHPQTSYGFVLHVQKQLQPSGQFTTNSFITAPNCAPTMVPTRCPKNTRD